MPKREEQGLTLVEMLAVLAIIGIAASVSLLGFGVGDRSRTVEAEAQRLGRTVQLAAEQAMVTGRPAVLAWDDAGYSFLQWSEEHSDWEAHGAASLSEPYLLPEGLRLASEDSPTTIRFGGTAATPFTINLVNGATAWVVRFDGLNVTALPDDIG